MQKYSKLSIPFDLTILSATFGLVNNLRQLADWGK
jgi:hypothetical protein